MKFSRISKIHRTVFDYWGAQRQRGSCTLPKVVQPPHISSAHISAGTFHSHHNILPLTLLHKHRSTHYITKTIILLYMGVGSDVRAYLYWMIGCLLFMLGFVFVNQHGVNIRSSSLSRGIGLLLTNGVMLWSGKGEGLTVGRQGLRELVLRHVILAVYAYGLAEAQFYLPAPIVFTIYYSGPLYILILDYYLYHVTITKRQTFGAITSTIGVLLNSNGWLITSVVSGESFYSQFSNYKTTSNITRSIVAILLIGLQLLWAYAMICMRELKNYSPVQLNFIFGVFLTSIAAVLYQTTPDNSFDGQIYLFFCCVALQGFVLSLSAFFQVQAMLMTSKLGIVTMVGLLAVVFSYGFSVLRYGEQLNGFCVLGAGLVVLGMYYIVIQ